MKTTSMILVIIIAIVCLVIGIGIGYNVGKKAVKKKVGVVKEKVEEEEVIGKQVLEEMSELAKSLLNLEKKTNLVEHFTAQMTGKVTKISESSIEISKERDVFKVKPVEFTDFYKEVLVEGEPGKFRSKPISLGDVKKGDRVTINIFFTNKGEPRLKALTVRLSPPK